MFRLSSNVNIYLMQTRRRIDDSAQSAIIYIHPVVYFFYRFSLNRSIIWLSSYRLIDNYL